MIRSSLRSSSVGRRVGFVASAAVLSIPVLGASALAAPTSANDHSTAGNAGTFGTVSSAQPLSNADLNPGGANNGGDCGAYCSTRNGTASANGNGADPAGKPCAGCVGRADNKNPQGQAPDASDHNNGYECDGNRGIAQGNPAHTGCTPTTVPVVAPPALAALPVVPAAPAAPSAPVAPAAAPVTAPAAAVVPAAPAVAPAVAPAHHASSGRGVVRAPAAPSAGVTSAPTVVLGERVTRSAAPHVQPVRAAVAVAPAALPFTGAPTVQLLLVALLALGVGVTFVLFGRRGGTAV